MKTLLCLTAFLILFHAEGYSQDYKARFKADICGCLENENITIKTVDNTYEMCFKKHLVTYAETIDSEIVEENVAVKLRKGQQARIKLQLNFRYELVYSCDVYYQTLEYARTIPLQKARLDPIDPTALEELNQQVAMTPICCINHLDSLYIEFLNFL